MDYEKELTALVDVVVQENASDLHLSADAYPTIRVDSVLMPLQAKRKLTAEDVMGFAEALLSEKQVQALRNREEIDFSYKHKDAARFRCNAYIERGNAGLAMRLIPRTIRSIEELNLPVELAEVVHRQQGFFLVVGPVGQGKTTTLASLINLINTERTEHIITIEDPIEYVFDAEKSIVDQREVGTDTKTFSAALKAAFRQDVDVLMIGEMRGTATMSAAVTAAETGHLVLSTLHTNDAVQTIDRIIDSFPEGQQGQIRLQLASSLAGIFSQRLIPRISGGLIPAYELLLNNTAVANLIREKRTHEIQTLIETGSDRGMVDMNRSLADLVRRGEVSVENAFSRSNNPKALEQLL